MQELINYPKDVSIIFVNYKTKDLTIGAIKSVRKKTNGINYEIFVVDNNSQDGSIEAIEQEFPGTNIIKNPENSGFGSANNLAIKQAQGKYILCLNTDTLLINNSIKELFDYMEKNPTVGACGGALYDAEQKPTHSGGLFPNLLNIILLSKLRYVFKNLYENRLGTKLPYEKMEYVTGADIFFRKSVLDEIGLFDENFFMYFEESDLCYRINKAGYKIKIVPQAKIIHLEGKSSTVNINKFKWFKASEQYYFKKHHPNKVWLVKLINAAIFFISAFILKNEHGKEMLNFILNNCKEVE